MLKADAAAPMHHKVAGFGVITVSYTHLDVYKRQMQYCMMAWTNFTPA